MRAPAPMPMLNEVVRYAAAMSLIRREAVCSMRACSTGGAIPNPMLQTTSAGKTIQGEPGNIPITNTEAAMTTTDTARDARGKRSLSTAASTRPMTAALP